ncbi:hypothetical protein D1007_36918 [Hordeum vulgare]|nr:hypothetical protein D1007_36918 [Hordeum vulgare]
MVRELFAVLVRAALQWALASLLLANGAAFCLIAAAASSLRLGPPCLLCARVHRLLCSDCGEEQQDAFRRLLCAAHLAAVARLGAAEPEPQACSPPHHVGTGTKLDSDKPRGLESHRVVSIGSEICEQDRGAHDDDQPRAAADILSSLERTSSIGSEGPYVSLFELAPLVALPPEDNPPDYAKEAPHGHRTTTKPEEDESASLTDVTGGKPALTVSGLVAALGAQRRELEAVRAELHGERRARAELEEQGELDREAARVAMQLVHETETEKHELQRQLDAFRVRAELYDDHDAGLETDYSAPPTNRLRLRPSRDGGLEVEDEASWGGNKNYQSLVDFLPGSVYSSSPDLANLLRLYTAQGNGNGARRQKEGDISITEEEEEEEEVVVAVTVTAAAVSGFDGGIGEATSTSAGGGGDQVEADLAQDEAAGVVRA